jgi:hypothetical protein
MRLKGSLAVLLAGVFFYGFAAPTTIVLQQGPSYKGCSDKEIRNPSKNYGSGPTDTIAQISEI